MRNLPWLALFCASLLRPLALAFAAALAMRIFRVRHPASRHAIWTAVALGTVLLPMLSVLLPHWKIPLLPAQPAAPRQTIAPIATAAVTVPAPEPAASLPVAPPRNQRPTAEEVAIWLYLAGALAIASRSLLGWMLARRMIRRSRSVHRRVLESSDIVVPVAAGLLRPSVLLPSNWREWTRETRRAVLAHEFAHIRRADAWTAMLARLVGCLLWFHPLAWWLSRKTRELAELACDADALDRVGDPAAYSRILVQFAGKIVGAGHRAALPGLAMADSSTLGSRIDQVFELSDGSLRRLSRPAATLALIGVPVLCLASTIGIGTAKPKPAWQARISVAAPAPLLAQVQPAPEAPQPAPARPASVVLEPRFEKASLKIADPPESGELCWGGCGGPGTPYPESQNEITYRHFTLKKILLRAYDLKDIQISVPPELDATPYTIQATAPAGVTKEQFQRMLRNLLIERLRLAAHHETKVFVTGYDLVATPGGAKLVATQAPSDKSNAGRTLIMIPFGDVGVNFEGSATTPITALTAAVTMALGSPVENKTGLSGNYDIDFGALFMSARLPTASQSGIMVPKFYRPGLAAQAPNGFAALRDRLEQQLGLTLIEKTEPLDYLVVDRADQKPSAD